MKKLERVRHTLKGDFDPAQTSQMAQAGWRPVAVEWEREVEAPGDANAAAEATPHYEELPYGLARRAGLPSLGRRSRGDARDPHADGTDRARRDVNAHGG